MRIKSNLRHLIVLFFWFIGRGTEEGSEGKTRVLVFHHLDKPERFIKTIISLKKRYNFVSFEDFLSGNVRKDKVNLIVAFDDSSAHYGGPVASCRSVPPQRVFGPKDLEQFDCDLNTSNPP